MNELPVLSNLLTHSRLRAARSCLKKHYYAYELGIRRDSESKALRFGGAYHVGLEVLGRGGDIAAAAHAVDQLYPAADGNFDLAVERETCVRLVCGHAWRWGEDKIKTLATEQHFEIQLRNPETGHPSRTWRLAGKIDRIVELPDGRVAVREFKTAGEDISPTSDYWQKLRIDSQISLYVVAAREIGYPVETIIYDVVRKPSISPKQIPTLDDMGFKIVLDAQGQRVMKSDGLPRLTGDAEKGWVLQSRIESPFEFGERLTTDIGERPDFYYQRQEIPRLDADIEEFRHELWAQGRTLADCRTHDRWYRNSDSCTNYGRCEYADLCWNGVDVADGLPGGFVRVTKVHPELSLEETHDDSDSPPQRTTQATGPATTIGAGCTEAG